MLNSKLLSNSFETKNSVRVSATNLLKDLWRTQAIIRACNGADTIEYWLDKQRILKLALPNFAYHYSTIPVSSCDESMLSYVEFSSFKLRNKISDFGTTK